MWKRRKVIVAAVLIAVVLVTATAGVALAQSPDGGAGPRQTMLAKVAKILGIDQQKLQDAFKQAATETRNEALDTWLKKQIADNKITQQQADTFKAWLKAKPEGVPTIGAKGLEKLLEQGKITKQQLDAYNAWLKAKPDMPLPKKPDFNGPRPGRGFAPGAKPAPQSFQPGTMPTI